jgi:hypothetical protein
MPHIDELLGAATVAAAGLFAATALQPVAKPAPDRAVPPTAAVSAPAPIVRLSPVEVVARRSVEVARIERDEKRTHEGAAKAASRTDAGSAVAPAAQAPSATPIPRNRRPA